MNKRKRFWMEKPKEYKSITAKILDVNKRGNYKIYISQIMIKFGEV